MFIRAEKHTAAKSSARCELTCLPACVRMRMLACACASQRSEQGRGTEQRPRCFKRCGWASATASLGLRRRLTTSRLSTSRTPTTSASRCCATRTS
eukprot:3318940-Pleurochrysis_carterae.AAC.1